MKPKTNVILDAHYLVGVIETHKIYCYINNKLAIVYYEIVKKHISNEKPYTTRFEYQTVITKVESGKVKLSNDEIKQVKDFTIKYLN